MTPNVQRTTISASIVKLVQGSIVHVVRSVLQRPTYPHEAHWVTLGQSDHLSLSSVQG